MMVNEEYKFEDISEYLKKNINIVFTGIHKNEDRSFFYSNEFSDKRIIELDSAISDNDCYITVQEKDKSKTVKANFFRDLFKFEIFQNSKVFVDITSLSHTVIMLLIRYLTQTNKPTLLFAGYVRPESYDKTKIDSNSLLYETVYEISSVPTFSARDKAGKKALIVFVGFDGERFKNITEKAEDTKIIPIIAFPSGTSNWFNTVFWNSLEVFSELELEEPITRCYSESVFSAYTALEKNLIDYDSITIAPFGTRAQTLASVLYYINNKGVSLLTDHAKEKRIRSYGVNEKIVYNITSFIVV
jgi:hypothetical protein